MISSLALSPSLPVPSSNHPKIRKVISRSPSLISNIATDSVRLPPLVSLYGMLKFFFLVIAIMTVTYDVHYLLTTMTPIPTTTTTADASTGGLPGILLSLDGIAIQPGRGVPVHSKHDSPHQNLHLGTSDAINRATITVGKEPIVSIFQQAGIALTETQIEQLPTWRQVVSLYGEHAILMAIPGGPLQLKHGQLLSLKSIITTTQQQQQQQGHESRHQAGDDNDEEITMTACRLFQQAIPPEQRLVGAAGMFSTGTNLITTLLKQNCYIPERMAIYGQHATKEQLGMRWQVPWGKHTPAHYYNEHATKTASNISTHAVLPVVTIRHPWRWMQSMCKNPYAARWKHTQQCPQLLKPEFGGRMQHNYIDGDDPYYFNPVSIKYGVGMVNYTSLAHVWNDWYHGYLMSLSSSSLSASSNGTSSNDAPPWSLMIRMEDLVVHTAETVTAVCLCVGGRMRTADGEPFHYVVDSAKQGSPKGHDTSIGMWQAWMRYVKEPWQIMAGLDPQDYYVARHVLDHNMMVLFHYQHPPEQ